MESAKAWRSGVCSSCATLFLFASVREAVTDQRNSSTITSLVTVSLIGVTYKRNMQHPRGVSPPPDVCVFPEEKGGS